MYSSSTAVVPAPPANKAIIVIGFIVYLSLIIYAAVQYFYMFGFWHWEGFKSRRISKFNEPDNSAITLAQKKIDSHSKIFNLLIIFFCILRISWLSGQTETSVNDYSFVLNRICQSIFFTAFSLIIVYWLEMQFTVNSFFSRHRKILFITGWVINFIVYGLTFFTIAMVLNNSRGAITRAQRQGGMYKFSASIISGTALLATLFFLFAGIGLFTRTKHTSKKAHIPRRAQCFMLSRISIITIILVVCNTLRTIMFLIFPMTNFQVQDTFYYPLAYFIPEVLPVVAQLYIALYTKQVQNKSLSIYVKSPSIYSNSPLITESASLANGSDENYFKINDDDDDVEDNVEDKEQTRDTN